MLRGILGKVFSGKNRLSLSENCFLTVEHHDGEYGSSSRPCEGISSDEYLEQHNNRAHTLSKDEQIQYWINLLNDLASGKEEKRSDWAFLADGHAINKLKEIGNESIEPLLQFVLDWSDKAEFDGDFPDECFDETSMSGPVVAALMCVVESGYATADIKYKLMQILKNSFEVIKDRELWGLIPSWTVSCLRVLFENVPEPVEGENNRITNLEEFF